MILVEEVNRLTVPRWRKVINKFVEVKEMLFMVLKCRVSKINNTITTTKYYYKC